MNICGMGQNEPSLSGFLNKLLEPGQCSCDIFVLTSSRFSLRSWIRYKLKLAMYSFIYRFPVSIVFSGVLRKMKFREMLLSDSETNMSKPGTSSEKGQEKKGDIELKFFELQT